MWQIDGTGRNWAGLSPVARNKDGGLIDVPNDSFDMAYRFPVAQSDKLMECGDWGHAETSLYC